MDSPSNISLAIFAATIGLWTWNQHRKGVPYVSKLYIYPIKSCKGISVQQAKITKTGFQYDRQYVIIDTNNRFISQRNFPKMALIDISIDEVKNELCLKAPVELIDHSVTLSMSYPTSEPSTEKVSIWGTECEVIPVGNELVDGWLDSVLETKGLRLMRMKMDFIRYVDPVYASAPNESQTAFADGFPFLLLSEESIQQFNDFLPSSDNPNNSVERFRPNIVIRNCSFPFQEDTWKGIIFHSKLSIVGDALKLSVVKPCSRCTIPDVEPSSGKMDKDHHITKVLQQFRRGEQVANVSKPSWNKKVFFGQNLDHEGKGEGRMVCVKDIFDVIK
jgi:uncharacterized protein YcbX